MRRRHPELADGALSDGCDVLALQETHVRPGELNLPGFVSYHSAAGCEQASCTAIPCTDSTHPAGRSRASLYVRAGLPQAVVSVDDLPCTGVECVAVTVRIGTTDTCVASVYACCGGRWDKEMVVRLSQRVRGDLVMCGDFNSHNTAWGSSHTDSSGRDLLDAIQQAGLLIANTGVITFARRGCEGSVLDLSLVSERCHYIWRRSPDMRGSDHYPIHLEPRRAAHLPTRAYNVVNWPRFRELCATVPVSECSGFFQHIAQCARAASTRCVVPAGTPVPDIKQLNLRAARRRAERLALRSGQREHWTVYNRLDAVCRRHAKQRRNASWSSLCSSLERASVRSSPWRILGAILRPRLPRCPALSIAVARGITNGQLAELLAETFCPPPTVRPPAPHVLQPQPHPRRELHAPERYFPSAGILEDIRALCEADFTIADCLADVIATLETTKRRGEAGYLVLLDVESAFDRLPHATIMDALDALGVCGRMRGYIAAFLGGRTMRVRVGGALSRPRAVVTGVPQGSVLSPFLFNLALGCDLVLQWVPAHIGIHGNEEADRLAKAAHTAPVPRSLVVTPFDVARHTVAGMLRARHPDARVASGKPPKLLPRSGLHRRDRALLLRLRIGCHRTAARTHRIQVGGTFVQGFFPLH
ncbi:uncharacterized protein [Dermacentor albipictus]|uniref:uncharacterized protein n=1 Tax=Dermacentor albipictus TaxID=60249 RepID=UPI0038FC3F92